MFNSPGLSFKNSSLPLPAFTSSWKTDNPGTSSSVRITLPLISTGTYDFTVDWGDGTNSHITVFNQAEVTHTYSIAGTYTVKIYGTITGWRFNNGGDRRKLLNISEWATLKFGTNQGNYFHGCSNLTITAIDSPDTSAVTSWISTFNGCAAITTIPSLNDWDFSAATSLATMFTGCSLFNQTISFNTNGSLTALNGFLQNASVFNSTISFDNTANVGSWADFLNAAVLYNQPISFTTTSATSFARFFQNALAFNNTISFTTTANVTTFQAFLLNCAAFNKPIVFDDCSSATTMSSMFSGCSSFNSTITLPNTSSVTTMSSMFLNATAFDQDISTLNIASLVSAINMLSGSGITTTNYNKILNINTGWPFQIVQIGTTFDAGTVQYSGGDAVAGRAYLTDIAVWTITDGGEV